MSQLETVVKWTKKLESTLEGQFGAEGRGLHEKASSVEHRLDAGLVRLLRRIATIRNKLMHEEGYKVEDIDRFVEDCDSAHKKILALQAGSQVRLEPASAVMARSVPKEMKVMDFLVREFVEMVAPVVWLTSWRRLKTIFVHALIFMGSRVFSKSINMMPRWTMCWGSPASLMRGRRGMVYRLEMLCEADPFN